MAEIWQALLMFALGGYCLVLGLYNLVLGRISNGVLSIILTFVFMSSFALGIRLILDEKMED